MIASFFSSVLALLRIMGKHLQSVLSGLFFATIMMHATTTEAMNASEAETLIRSAPCINGQTIEAVLGQKINTASQRDLGWQIFEDNGSYIVERGILISKSMQLRYRWKVDSEGKLQPASDRAEDLCAVDE